MQDYLISTNKIQECDYNTQTNGENIPVNDTSVTDFCRNSWPENLQELYRRSCDNLKREECADLAKLLDKYSHCFAKSPTDLGRTSVVQHTIDTGNTQPIRTAPRMPPKAFEGEEEKIIKPPTLRRSPRNRQQAKHGT